MTLVAPAWDLLVGEEPQLIDAFTPEERARLLTEARLSPATSAMATAIITDRTTISAAARQKLAPLVGRYL